MVPVLNLRHPLPNFDVVNFSHTLVKSYLIGRTIGLL